MYDWSHTESNSTEPTNGAVDGPKSLLTLMKGTGLGLGTETTRSTLNKIDTDRRALLGESIPDTPAEEEPV